mgnify:CR=1 FL=1
MDTHSTAQPIALVTATRKEMHAVLGPRAQGLPMKVNCVQEIPWGRRTLLLLITGIGPVNAAMALGKLVGQRPDLAGVVNMGIAGSFSLQAFPLGSVVGVHTEIWPEFGLYTEEGVDAKGLGFGQGRVRNKVVWDSLSLQPDVDAQNMGLELDSGWSRVVSLSVAGVSGTIQRARQLQTQTNADIENMEGFALAWACTVHGLPFVQIRSISNRVGWRSQDEWDMDSAFTSLGRAGKCLLGADKDPLPVDGQ